MDPRPTIKQRTCIASLPEAIYNICTVYIVEHLVSKSVVGDKFPDQHFPEVIC